MSIQWNRRAVGVTGVFLAMTAAGLIARESFYAGLVPPPATPVDARLRSGLPHPTVDRQSVAMAEYPLAFEPNHGQVDLRVKFLARTSGYSAFLTNTGATLVFPRSPQQPAQRLRGNGTPAADHRWQADRAPGVLRVSFAGASPNSEVSGRDQLSGRTNYLSGSDSSRWHTDIPTFSRVFYRSVYPGIDLMYYGTGSKLEYDFILRPGADPGLVRLKYDGASSVRIDQVGDLVLNFGDHEVTQKKALVYQERGGRRQEIAGRYRLLAENEVGVEVGPYDAARPLVVDPALVFSAAFGPPVYGAFINAMATDSSGNVYVTGTAEIGNFPTTPGAFQTSGPGGLNEIFVSKLSADGTQLLYSTYLSGLQNEVDDGLAIAVDSAGQAYVVGDTADLDFPTTASGFQRSAGSCPNPSGTYCDGFLTVLNASGTGLVYSTYVGGTDQDRVQGVALDPQGFVYLTGQTVSTDFPTTPGAYLTSIPPTSHFRTWAFITKIDPRKSGSASLVYSTYVGGDHVDARGIAADAAGNTYIVGAGGDPSTYPTTPGAFQTSGGGCFVTKMNPSGSALVYSTFLGSSFPTAVAIDPDGNAYVTGWTSAANFPTTSGAFQPTLPGPGAASFVSKLNPSGSALVFSTFVGGVAAADFGVGGSIALDSARNVYITGRPESTEAAAFPTTPVTLDALCGGFTANCFAAGAAFVTELNSSGTSLVFSTFLGSDNRSSGVAVDPATGDIVVAGTGGVPTTPGSFSTPGQVVFVTKISPTAPGPAIAISPGIVTFPPQAIGTTSKATLTVTSRGNAPLTISALSSITGVGPQVFSQTNNCVGNSLPPTATCTITFSFTPSDTINYSDTLTVSDNAINSPHTLYLQGAGGTALLTLSTSSLTFLTQVLNTSSAPQTITMMNAGSAEIQFSDIKAAGDFSQTNTCVGSILAIGANCTISVVFAPTAAGSRTGAITIIDNAPNSPQTVALGGTGVDFSMSAASTSATVSAGQSASYTLNVTPLGGFNQSVSLACSGAPRGANCTVSPSSVTPNGSSSASANVTVSTTSRSVLTPPKWISFRGPVVLPVGLVSTMLLLLFLAARLERNRRRVGLAFCLMTVAFLGAAGCGGGSSSGGSGGPNPNGTPAGTYSLTVTATSGGATRTTTLQLIVN